MQLQGSTNDEHGKINEEVQALQKERDQLLKRRNSMDEKLKNGRVLSPDVSNLLIKMVVLEEYI